MRDKRYISDVPIVKENDSWRSLVSMGMVIDRDKFKNLASLFKQQDKKVIAIDTETSSLDFENCIIVGFSICFDTTHSYYIPLRHKVGKNYPDIKEAFDILFEILYIADIVLMYNYQWDARILRRCGINLDKIIHFDVMALIWNLDTNVPLPSLKQSALNYLGVKGETYTEVAEQANLDFSYVPSEKGYYYAAGDSWMTFILYKRFKSFYEKNKLIISLDNKIAHVMMKLEEQPIYLDINKAKNLALEYKSHIEEIKNLIYKETGQIFDINSPSQLADVMTSNGIPLTMKTKKTNRFSTKAEAIDALADDYPLVKIIQKYRTVTSELSKNIIPFIETKKDHCRFKYTIYKVVTGRFSSGGVKNTKTKKMGYFFISVNVHSIPKPKPAYYRMIPCSGSDNNKPSVLGYTYTLTDDKSLPDVVEGKKPGNAREILIAPKGHLVACIDHAGQELVLAGNVSGDTAFINPLKRGEDLHRDFSDRAFGKDKYSEDTRKNAKGCNFGLLYGGNSWTLKKKLTDKTDEECQEMVNVWEKLHIQYLNYNKKCSEVARKTGFVRSQFGRIRRVAYWYKSYLKKDHYFADRTVKNTQIQGLGADIMRFYLCKFYDKYGKDPFYKDKVNFMVSLHDEFNFSIIKDSRYFTDIVLGVGKLMCDLPFNWPVPLTVNYSFGPNWGMLFPFEYKDGNWAPKYINK